MRALLLGGPRHQETEIFSKDFMIGRTVGGVYVRTGRISKCGRVILEFICDKANDERLLTLLEELQSEKEESK